MSSTIWYEKGLNFSCTRCGNCCTGPPGYVWFNDDEAAMIAKSLGLSMVEFRHRFAKRIDGKWSLAEVFRDGKYDCVFLTRDEQGRSGCHGLYSSTSTVSYVAVLARKLSSTRRLASHHGDMSGHRRGPVLSFREDPYHPRQPQQRIRGSPGRVWVLSVDGRSLVLPRWNLLWTR